MKFNYEIDIQTLIFFMWMHFNKLIFIKCNEIYVDFCLKYFMNI